MPLPAEIETEHVLTFQVRVRAFGRREKTEPRVLLEAARHLEYAFGGRFEIQRPDGVWVRYDGRGDDMGNHGPEHDRPFIPVED